MATPFLYAAGQRYQVTLLAKPYAVDLQRPFWLDVTLVPFIAPWTTFKYKHRLLAWPWGEVFRLCKGRTAQRFDFGLSACWDPRDHLLLWRAKAKTRLGFPRVGTGIMLARRLARPEPSAHRYEIWCVIAREFGFKVPVRDALRLPQLRPDGEVLVHTDTGQPVRVWPLERYRGLVGRLRQENHRVHFARDPEQQSW